MVQFTATVFSAGGNTAGLEVPPAVIDELGGGKRPAVQVAIGDYSFRYTVGVMGGKTLIGLSQAIRKETGIAVGDVLDVVVELATEPAVIEVPADLAEALAVAGVRAAFDALSPSKRKEAVRQVVEAKAADTRARRIEKVVASLG